MYIFLKLLKRGKIKKIGKRVKDKGRRGKGYSRGDTVGMEGVPSGIE